MSQELPAFLQRLLPAGQAIGQASIGGITGFPQPPHISIRGSRFHLVDGQGEEETLRDTEIEIVVVDANPHISRIYYGKEYDPNASDASPPKCFSDNGVAPSSQAMVPQHANCAGCPQAVWGSATSKLSGKGIPACSERKKLAVLYDGELFQLVVPPASLGAWREYYASVTRIPNIGVNMLKTNVSFDTKAVGILQFRAASLLDEATANQVFTITNDPAYTIKLIGKDDKPHQGALPAPEVKPTLSQMPVKQMVNEHMALLAPVEQRIHTITAQKYEAPAMPALPEGIQHTGTQAANPKRRKRNVVAAQPGPSAGQQAEANNFVKAAVEKQEQASQFGMQEAMPAVNDDQLRALLAGAVGFANKQ